MAWIFLAASAGSASHSSPGCEPSPIVKTIDTLSLFCCLECGGVTWTERPSVMTCERCDSPTWLGWTSYLEASHAKTSVSLEMEQAWEASGRDFSSKSSDYVAIFDRDSFSWKTSQLSLFGGSTEFSWSSLRSGMTVGGRLYQPPNLEPRTCASGGGYWPTPVARDWKGQGMSKERRETRKPDNLCSAVKALDGRGTLNPTWVEWLMGYPKEWTALDASVTPWFRGKRAKHSSDSQESKGSPHDPPR